MRSMITDILCDVCAEELLLNKNESTYKLSGFYESLIFVKEVVYLHLLMMFVKVFQLLKKYMLHQWF